MSPRVHSFHAVAVVMTVAGINQVPAAAESITVINPSFEQPAIALCAFGPGTVGWTSASGDGVWHTGLANECFYDAYPNGVADGLQTSYINIGGAATYQVLDEELAPNTTYKLSVAVGRRTDHIVMEDYRIELAAGLEVIAEDPGILDPDPGTWEVSTICVTTGSSHPQIGQKLAIRLYLIDGIQANFDDVRLEKFPAQSPVDCNLLEGTPGDIDGSGAVDGADLGLLLGAWGACGDCDNCPEDVNGDCVVDGADLGILLGNWT